MYQDQAQLAPKQDGEVHDFLNHLDLSLQMLMDSVNTMEHRLAPVLRSTNPAVASKDGLSRCPGTQVGERLARSLNQINHANDVLREALDRLEV